MDKQQTLDEIASLEKKIANPSLPESAKNAYRKKIETLKANMGGVEKKEEKLVQEVKAEEKKAEAQEKKEEESQEDLEKTIKKAKAVMDNKSMPDSAKKAHKKKLDDAEEKLKKFKKEATEEKKEVKKKLVRKAPAKEKIKKVKEAKKKSEAREKKIKRIMTELEMLVENSKKLKKKYSGQGVDLEKDSVRRAKPFGYRYKGKHNYRTVTLEGKRLKTAIKDGRVYKETRPNKADSTYKKASKKTYPMLEEGGMTKAKSGGMFSSKYNTGLSWHQDHARHNKREDYEVPVDKRKK